MAVEDLDYVKLVGRFGLVVADGADEDDVPDHIFADSGTVEITPMAAGSLRLATEDGLVTIGLSKITATIDAEGYLSYNGSPGVWLVDPASEHLSVKNWTYRLEFRNVKNGANTLQIAPLVFAPQSGVENDIGELVPSPNSPGAVVPAVSAIVFDGETYRGVVNLDEFDLGSGGGGGGAVSSVNEKTGDVVLNAVDVGARADSWLPTWSNVQSKPTTFPPVIGSGPGDAVAGNDARLTNARTPTTHSHPTSQITDFAAEVTALAEATLSALVDGAPGTLDTLNEIAAALGDDPDFAATMTTQLAGKVPTTRTVAGKPLSANVSLVKGDVGLGNVDNTSDASKPVSTATQSALDGKLDEDAVLTYENSEPGSLFRLTWDTSWPARPSARTDIFWQWVDPRDPAVPSDPPPTAIDGDSILRRAEA